MNRLPRPASRRAAHDGTLHPGLVLESSPMGNIPAEEHDSLVMLAQYVHQDGIIFREELVTGAEWAPTYYPDAFAPGTATDRVRRHLEAGALREQVPWRRGEAPLAAMSSVFPEGIDGVGGRCDSPLSFCMALAVDNDGDRELSAAFIRNQRSDVEQAAARATLTCGATAAPRHLGVMLQPVASSWEDLSGGDHLMVLNNTGSGIGAYQARFHRLFGETFRQDLEAEINGLWPGRKVLELTAWADCNTGQAMCTGVLPELQLPGEPKSPRGVALESLSLIHDPVTDSLELWDDDGPVGLAYLGLTPQHVLDAVRDGEDLSVRRIDELRRRQHLPRQVFVQQCAAGGGATNDRRKPQFVDLASRTSLSSLAHWLDSDARTVRITEPLPGAGEHPHHDPHGHPRVSELAVSLRWPGQEER